MLPESGNPQSGTPWATPIRDRRWTDPDGTLWHIRGGPLDERSARRLLRRSEVRVLHVNGPEPHLVDGSDLAALMARLDEFFALKVLDYWRFRIADFRDDDHNVLAVVEESY